MDTTLLARTAAVHRAKILHSEVQLRAEQLVAVSGIEMKHDGADRGGAILDQIELGGAHPRRHDDEAGQQDGHSLARRVRMGDAIDLETRGRQVFVAERDEIIGNAHDNGARLDEELSCCFHAAHSTRGCEDRYW